MRKILCSVILLLAVLTTIPVMATAKKPSTQAETYSVTFTGAIVGEAGLTGLRGGRSLQGYADLEFDGAGWNWEEGEHDFRLPTLHDGILVIRINKGTGEAEIIYDFDREPFWNGKRGLNVPTFGLQGTGTWQEDENRVEFDGTVDMYRIEASQLTKKGGVSLAYIYLTTLTVGEFVAQIDI